MVLDMLKHNRVLEYQ